MSSNRNSGFRYFRDRCVNAYWMLRTGKFKLIVKSFSVELVHRAQIIRNLLSRPEPVAQSQVSDSEFTDRRKVLPASYRPTTAQPPLAVPLCVDTEVIARDLKQILAAISVDEGVSQ